MDAPDFVQVMLSTESNAQKERETEKGKKRERKERDNLQERRRKCWWSKMCRLKFMNCALRGGGTREREAKGIC